MRSLSLITIWPAIHFYSKLTISLLTIYLVRQAPGCGGGETRQYKDSETRQWMASLGLRWGSCFISTLLDGILQARIGLQDFLRGGGREDVHKHTHTPLEHCPRDVIRPPENPHSWTFTSTPPPWTLPVWRHPHSAGGGGGVIGPGHARTLCCIGYSINITRSQRT